MQDSASTASSSTKAKKKDEFTESMSTLAHNFSDYLAKQETTTAAQVQPPLVNYPIWANYDRMTRDFDEDAMVDLNMQLMVVIGNAVKEQRNKKKQAE